MLTFLLRRVQPLLEGVLERRASRMADLIASELGIGQQVLDIGCGDLRIGRGVTARMKVQWTGVDTIDYRGPAGASPSNDRVHFRTYKGDVLPFASATFDTVVLAFVLHHCDDPQAVLDEALRVTRCRLIVFEALPRNRLEFWIAKPYDWLVNRLRSSDIALPFTFMSPDTLVAAFHSRNLRLIRAIPVRTHPLALIMQMMFVVERPPLRE